MKAIKILSLLIVIYFIIVLNRDSYTSTFSSTFDIELEFDQGRESPQQYGGIAEIVYEARRCWPFFCNYDWSPVGLGTVTPNLESIHLKVYRKAEYSIAGDKVKFLIKDISKTLLSFKDYRLHSVSINLGTGNKVEDYPIRLDLGANCAGCCELLFFYESSRKEVTNTKFRFVYPDKSGTIQIANGLCEDFKELRMGGYSVDRGFILKDLNKVVILKPGVTITDY